MIGNETIFATTKMDVSYHAMKTNGFSHMHDIVTSHCVLSLVSTDDYHSVWLITIPNFHTHGPQEKKTRAT